MSISKYVDRFKHLGKFHTLRMDEECLYKKFKNGLRRDLKLMITTLSIKELLTFGEEGASDGKVES